MSFFFFEGERRGLAQDTVVRKKVASKTGTGYGN